MKTTTQYVLIDDFDSEYYLDSNIDCDELHASVILVDENGMSVSDVLGVSCQRLTNSNVLAVYDALSNNVTKHQFRELKRVVGHYKFDLTNYTSAGDVSQVLMIKLEYIRND